MKLFQKCPICDGELAEKEIEEGVILIQGGHRQTLLDEIRKQGYTAKVTGG
jgi:translation initiation factor 1 (eIF-1/SUI1)